jgi:TPR repeat protein
MKRLLILPVLLLTLLVGNPAFSADFQKGLTAARSGDFATALREWRPLAEQGNVTAQYNLGLMYDNGTGVPQDYKTAAKWYRLAAEQGVAVAQGNLGEFYRIGKGVPQDIVYAHMWGNLASSNGNENGGKLRDFVAKQMTPADISAAQKLARECVTKNYKGC